MPEFTLAPSQLEIIHFPADRKVFLEGPAGTGKTTIGIERMLYLMSSGIHGGAILVLVPQRTLGVPYIDAMSTPGTVAGGMPTISTISGLARQVVELFWPMIAEKAGFSSTNKPPKFLNLETAQYYMSYLVKPLIDKGLFHSVTIERNRIYSQIIDNLNKAAIVGFGHQEIGERLKSAWSGEPGQARIYEDAQTCASLFRQYCLLHNLLDFSLQIEVFRKYLWKSNICQDFLTGRYRHLVIDNLEEDIPVTHDLIADWLPVAESGFLIYDQDAGYRRFLGADPNSAYRLKEICSHSIKFTNSYVSSSAIQSLQENLKNALVHKPIPQSGANPRLALSFVANTYYPQMLDWITAEVEKLIKEDGVPPKEIVILAPFLSDSLRFSIVNRLEKKQIPVKTHRPSRSLRDEPATLCLLSLASIAHPQWGIVPSNFDIAYSLMQAIDGLDLIRARLMTDIVYRTKDGPPRFTSFDQVLPAVQQRISYTIGEKFEHLRNWIDEYQQSTYEELDYFLSMLFGEVLSQPGYGFHQNFDLGMVTANLIESIRQFRKVTGENLSLANVPLGREYVQMVHDGLIAAQYIPRWQTQKENAVYVAPAYTFLINNIPLDYQFWLDIGNRSWAERLYQPLTHPYVLSRNWNNEKTWTDFEEVETSDQVLYALVIGLLKRCRKKIYLGLSEYNEQGYEQRGSLLQAFHRILMTWKKD